jgi:hypothetical protein
MTKSKSVYIASSIGAMVLAAAAIVSMSIISAASAAEHEEGEGRGPCAGGEHVKGERPLPPIAEVIEVDTDANTIVARVNRPGENGEPSEGYVLIHYTDDTEFHKPGGAGSGSAGEADEDAISVGDRIHARGERVESDEYDREINAKEIRLFDEEDPRPRPFKRAERLGEREAV